MMHHLCDNLERNVYKSFPQEGKQHVRYHLHQCGFFSEINCLMRCYIHYNGNCFPHFANWNCTIANGLTDYLNYPADIFPTSSEYIDIIRPQESFHQMLRDSKKWSEMDDDLRQLANRLWYPNDDVLKIAEVGVDDYVSVHVRLGDKGTETDLWSYDAWAVIINSLPHGTIYCACDDSNFIKYLRSNTDKSILCIDKPQRIGHMQQEFNRLPLEERYHEVCCLLAEVELCRRSRLHVYRDCSNVDWYIRWIRERPVMKFPADASSEQALGQVISEISL